MPWKQLAIGGLALLAASCAPAPPAGDTADAGARETVEAVFEAFNRHDAAAMATLYAPDAVLHSSEFCEPQRGRETIERIHRELFAAVPDIQDEVTDIFVGGEKVAVRFVSRSELPARAFEMTFGDFFIVRDGLVVSDDTIFNFGQPCLGASQTAPASTD